MIHAAAVSSVPAWLAAALVGMSALAAIANALGGVIGDFVQLRRLEALDRQRTEAEQQRHQELLAAINNQRGGSDEQ